MKAGWILVFWFECDGSDKPVQSDIRDVFLPAGL